jgi:hypothetical protein
MQRRMGLCLLGVVLALPVLAQSSAALNLDRDGVAIKGHDPVAYFTMNKPVKGSPSFMAKHDGATYWFGVAKGAKPDIDPTAFSVVDGKLYLNLNPDVQSRWLKDVPGYIKTADENWKSLATK